MNVKLVASSTEPPVNESDYGGNGIEFRNPVDNMIWGGTCILEHFDTSENFVKFMLEHCATDGNVIDAMYVDECDDVMIDGKRYLVEEADGMDETMNVYEVL